MGRMVSRTNTQIIAIKPQLELTNSWLSLMENAHLSTVIYCSEWTHDLVCVVCNDLPDMQLQHNQEFKIVRTI